MRNPQGEQNGKAEQSAASWMRDKINREKEIRKDAPLDFIKRPDGVWELQGVAA